MILSSELLPNWDTKKMNLDEQISKRVDKQMLNELVNGNVILLHSNLLEKFKNPRSESFEGFFYLN